MKLNITLLVMDADGVLTDGAITYNALGEEIKSFHVRDGYGLKMLHLAGIRTAIISGRKSEALRHRASELNIDYLYMGINDKLPVLKKLSTELGIPLNQVAYVGDDIPDLQAMLAVAFPITVANGDARLKKIALWVTEKNGGQGAVREICDWILEHD